MRTLRTGQLEDAAIDRNRFGARRVDLAQGSTRREQANRLDDEVKFTLAAAKQLTGIPNAFIQNVLGGIVKQAKARGITEVDEDFVIALNKEREN